MQNFIKQNHLNFAIYRAQKKLIVNKMSQFWHAHWAEDGYRPKRLGNWEVPRWHAQWPDMHCATTRFEAHKNGRLFTSVPRSDNPWSNFKGTWELPLKIDGKTAQELSRATECKKAFWDAHNLKNQQICQRAGRGKCKGKRIEGKIMEGSHAAQVKSKVDKPVGDKEIEKNQDAPSSKSSKDGEDCKIKEACLI